jgi:hypothetical protein
MDGKDNNYEKIVFDLIGASGIKLINISKSKFKSYKYFPCISTSYY